MAALKRLSWGLLSTARINRAVIGPIQNSKKSQLYAVASRNAQRAADYSRAWGIPRAYGSYEELLADPGIDVIYNSLPNGYHAEWSIKAMQMGKHVLCEKPITTSTEDLDKVANVAQQASRVITEAFMYRHHPQTSYVKRMIEQGEIGKLQLIRGSFCYTNTRPDNPRLDPDIGGGSLWDVGCYPIGYARYLTGEEPVEVYGRQVTGPTGIDLFYAGQLYFPSGVIAQFECSFISPYKVFIEVTGEKGRITVPEPYKPQKKGEIYLEREQRRHTIAIKGPDVYQGEIEDIENAIISCRPPTITLRESRGNVATIEALYQSSHLSRPTQIQP